jgi:tetratricopeptide (TPR) repeat protein
MVVLLSLLAISLTNLQQARDHQDRPALEKMASELSAAADKRPADPEAQYQTALAYSYLAEVSQEQRDNGGAKRAAESGIHAAERAVALKPSHAEYHRILGTLCGQVIPANVLAGFSYGKRARESVEKAIQLDPKSAQAYVSRGVGNYYLPSVLGGGIDLAIGDFRKAIELDPKLDEAYLWLGLALRKQSHNAEARKAFEKVLDLNPDRAWAKQQLDKTPAN